MASVSDQFLQVSVLEVSLRSCLCLKDYMSWSQVYCFEALNTPTIQLSKASEIQPVFCLLYLQVGKMPEIQKNSVWKWCDVSQRNFRKLDKFLKKLTKLTNFQDVLLHVELKSQSWSHSFNKVLEVTVSTTSLIFTSLFQNQAFYRYTMTTGQSAAAKKK